MNLDNSNKRISNIIAGILVVVVVSVFIAIALGLIGENLYLEDKTSDPLLLWDLGNSDFVPIAQTCPGGEWDTDAGSIEVVQEDLADLFEFPLCFNPSDPQCEVNSLLDTWFRVYKVCGGYYPCDCGTQAFDLYQQNKLTGELEIVTSPGYYVGWSLDWHQLTAQEIADGYDGIVFTFDTIDDCCCTSYWIATINTDCNNPGCIDSNQWPDVPDDCTMGPTFSAEIPGKEIIAELTSTWCGCPVLGQRFVLILVQIFRIPDSRVNI
jgi:hypothetical protein